jgi:two-component system sensor histidine kinase DesK
MHDDLGAGISALKLQAEFIKQKVDDQSVKADVDDLLKTAGEMNLSMREMLWSLNSTNDNLGNFMQYVVQYAEVF